MALPNEDCAPVEACSSLHDIAQNLLDIAFPAVAECASYPDCGVPELVGYVSMGRQIEDPIADFVAVSLLAVTPSSRSADAYGNMIQPVYRASFQVKLLETGWPTPWGDDEEIVPPTPEQYADAAQHSYAHGEAMYRALANALASRTLVPNNKGCFQAIDALLPLEPSGGATGWMTNIITDAFSR